MADEESAATIVVGYDGSPSARAALRLAVDRVGRGKLFIVHGYGAPADFWGGAQYDQILQLALLRGQDVLDRASRDDPRVTGVDHELELIAGRPAEVIAGVAQARGADEIIVGTRGFGRLRGALGSVAHALLHEARCPVTVIPDAAVARTEAAGREAAVSPAPPP